MNELALFAGAGGGILGSRLLGWRTVCAVEIDPFCACRLMQRQNEGLLEPFPIWDDVRTFDGHPWRGLVDVVSAGFPCQPVSRNSRILGPEDERWLWPDTFRIYCETGARWLLVENVVGLLSANAGREFGSILWDLAAGRCGVRWDCIPASSFGAPHQRDRLWLVADTEGAGWEELLRDHPAHGFEAVCREALWPRPLGSRGDLVHRLEERLGEPGICGVDDGVPDRLDRLSALGNGQVPLVAATAWRLLTEDWR